MIKTIIIISLFLLSISNLVAQNLPEFNDKPALYNAKSKQIIELEKSQYNTIAKAKGLFSAEGGFFLNGATSNIKTPKQDELLFIILHLFF